MSSLWVLLNEPEFTTFFCISRNDAIRWEYLARISTSLKFGKGLCWTETQFVSFLHNTDSSFFSWMQGTKLSNISYSFSMEYKLAGRCIDRARTFFWALIWIKSIMSVLHLFSNTSITYSSMFKKICPNF